MSTLLRAAFGSALLLSGACAIAQTPAMPPPIIATQETNISGVVADVTEFRRKGNTLTAKVRFRNTGTAKAEISFEYTATYLLDTEAGKKYEVLKDERAPTSRPSTPGIRAATGSPSSPARRRPRG